MMPLVYRYFVREGHSLFYEERYKSRGMAVFFLGLANLEIHFPGFLIRNLNTVRADRYFK